MGKHAHSHAHGSGSAEDVRVGRVPRLLLIGGLLLVAAATALGMFLLWPHSDELSGTLEFAEPGTTFPEATVDRVEPRCPPTVDGAMPEEQDSCGHVHATVAEGPDRGMRVSVTVPPEVSDAGLTPEDRIELLRAPVVEGEPAQYGYFGIAREVPLRTLLIVFVGVVVAVAWLRGLMALVSLVFAAAVVWTFVLPALLSGEPPIWAACVGSAAILYVVLYATHGLSLRTSVALAGTLAGVAITAVLAAWSVGSARLTGVSDEGGNVLTTYASSLDVQGLFVTAVIIAGLGVLNDVTITQSSAVWELRGMSAGMSRLRLFASAMRIGRDHIASSIYTIVFAYAGTALTVLLVISLYDRPLLDLVGTEEIAEEIVRSLVSTIGLVLAVPITTALAAVVVPGPQPAAEGADG